MRYDSDYSRLPENDTKMCTKDHNHQGTQVTQCFYRNSTYELVVTDHAHNASIRPQNVWYDATDRKWRAQFLGVSLGTYPNELFAKTAYLFARTVHPNGWDTEDDYEVAE